MSAKLVRLPALMVETGLTLGVIRGFVARGELHPVKLGRMVYFDFVEVRHLIETARRRRQPASPPSARAA